MVLTSLCALSFMLLAMAQEKPIDEEAQEKRMRRITAYFEDFLPEGEVGPGETETTGQCQEKRNVGREVAELLAKKFNCSDNYVFQAVVAGSHCAVTSGEPRTILHLKLAEADHCSTSKCTCDAVTQPLVYCSWIGTLRNNKPRKTIGYVCFQTKTLMAASETELLMGDSCSELKYDDEGDYRLPIPAFKSGWKEEFLLYNPPVTSLKGGLLDALQYCTQFGSNGNCDLSQAPKNPEGRTGISGRGLLLKWGENKMEIPVIIRDLKDGVEVLVREKFAKGRGETPLPMFYKVSKRDKGDDRDVVQSLESHFHQMIETDKKKECTEKKLRSSLKLLKRLFDGYLPHPHTTDNAWVKVKVFIIMTRKEQCYGHLDLSKAPKDVQYTWKKFNFTGVHDLTGLVEALFKKKEATDLTTAAVQFRFNFDKLNMMMVTIAVGALVATTTTAALPLLALPGTLLLLTAATLYVKRRWIRPSCFLRKPTDTIITK